MLYSVGCVAAAAVACQADDRPALIRRIDYSQLIHRADVCQSNVTADESSRFDDRHHKWS